MFCDITVVIISILWCFNFLLHLLWLVLVKFVNIWNLKNCVLLKITLTKTGIIITFCVSIKSFAQSGLYPQRKMLMDGSSWATILFYMLTIWGTMIVLPRCTVRIWTLKSSFRVVSHSTLEDIITAIVLCGNETQRGWVTCWMLCNPSYRLIWISAHILPEFHPFLCLPFFPRLNTGLLILFPQVPLSTEFWESSSF